MNGDPLLTAVLLAVGSELTTGETRDTNAGELARYLTAEGVTVQRLEAVPDRLPVVVETFRRALATADLVISTGGLGPTPDDLTREAIAEAVGETPAPDPELQAWLRNLFERRGVPYPEANMKQAWLIPSGRAIPNNHGTAPGWWVEHEGKVILALPGPPSEMRAMWREWVLPHLRERGLGRDLAVTTYRLSGIGESHVAAALGEQLLRAENPTVATYARADAVDVRISAFADGQRPASDVLAEAAAFVEERLGHHVWGRDDETWEVALARELGRHGWTVAVSEVGTGGSLVRLLGEAPFLAGASVLPGRQESAAGATATEATAAGAGRSRDAMVELAETVRIEYSASVGLAVQVDQSGSDTAVDLAAVGPWGVAQDRRLAFLRGVEGRHRAALTAALFLYETLRGANRADDADSSENQGGQGDSAKGS